MKEEGKDIHFSPNSSIERSREAFAAIVLVWESFRTLLYDVDKEYFAYTDWIWSRYWHGFEEVLIANTGFLQFDIEAVTIRMEEQFIKYGKGRIILEDDDEGNRWLPENPFEVRSDWEQHTLDQYC
ncbi:hypothetical protein KSP40_PGU010601 [Platanthera guangdongensis]|uniref:Uncharacterized protein n=1 Tax=Platanthera guangdongensis TaxID=2320717 RepID=A0ABR2M6E2_9ASPA